MAYSVQLLDETTARSIPHPAFRLDFEEETVTVRELIRRRVYEECCEYNAGQQQAFRGLVTPEAAETALNGQQLGTGHDTDTTGSGSYLRVRTDQLRFYPIDAPANSAHAGGGYGMWLQNGAAPINPLPLESIPPLVLSEIMRDVDLFVGVASVGNDPTWQDGGPQGRFREYWQGYSFGELSETAKSGPNICSASFPASRLPTD